MMHVDMFITCFTVLYNLNRGLEHESYWWLNFSIPGTSKHEDEDAALYLVEQLRNSYKIHETQF